MPVPKRNLQKILPNLSFVTIMKVADSNIMKGQKNVLSSAGSAPYTIKMPNCTENHDSFALICSFFKGEIL
jgi:hypothetical protein